VQYKQYMTAVLDRAVHAAPYLTAQCEYSKEDKASHTVALPLEHMAWVIQLNALPAYLLSIFSIREGGRGWCIGV
jgi:hypothetical protein